MRLVNGKPIRSRGRKSILDTKEKLLVPSALAKMNPLVPAGYGESDGKRVEQMAKSFLISGFQTETVKDHVVPRQSLEERLHLSLFPQSVETESRGTKQRDTTTGQMVPTTDQKVVWKSDKHLLRRGNPFLPPTDIKRQTSGTKRVTRDADTDFGVGQDKTFSNIISDLDTL